MREIIGRAVRKAVLIGAATFCLVSLAHHGGLPTDPHHAATPAGPSVQLPSYWWCPQGFSDAQCGA